MSPRTLRIGIGAVAAALALALALTLWAVSRPTPRSAVYRANHQNDVVVTEFGTCTTNDIRPDLGDGSPPADPGFQNVLLYPGVSDNRPPSYTEVGYLDASGTVLGGLYSTDNFTSPGHSEYLTPDQITHLGHTRCVTVTPDSDTGPIPPVWAVYPVHVTLTALDLTAAPDFHALLDGHDDDGAYFLSTAASAETLTVTGWPAPRQIAGVWTGIPWQPVPTH